MNFNWVESEVFHNRNNLGSKHVMCMVLHTWFYACDDGAPGGGGRVVFFCSERTILIVSRLPIKSSAFSSVRFPALVLLTGFRLQITISGKGMASLVTNVDFVNTGCWRKPMRILSMPHERKTKHNASRRNQTNFSDFFLALAKSRNPWIVVLSQNFLHITVPSLDTASVSDLDRIDSKRRISNNQRHFRGTTLSAWFVHGAWALKGSMKGGDTLVTFLNTKWQLRGNLSRLGNCNYPCLSVRKHFFVSRFHNYWNKY